MGKAKLLSRFRKEKETHTGLNEVSYLSEPFVRLLYLQNKWANIIRRVYSFLIRAVIVSPSVLVDFWQEFSSYQN